MMRLIHLKNGKAVNIRDAEERPDYWVVLPFGFDQWQQYPKVSFNVVY